MFGIAVGLFMSSSLDLKWSSSHGHVNLVGFALTAIFGVIYSIYPKAAKNSLGKAHFWLHHIGTPIFLLSAFFVQVPELFDTAHIFTYLGGGALGLGAIFFVFNAFKNFNDATVSSKN